MAPRKERSDKGKGKHYEYVITPGKAFFHTTHDGEPFSSPNVQVRLTMSMYRELRKASIGMTTTDWLRIAIAEKLSRDSIVE